MSIVAGNDILVSDFVSTSAGAGDSGKVPKLASADGKLDRTFIRSAHGGTGADGALSVSSGTTNIDLAGAAVFIKNYSSISITGTGKVVFINPHANGTIIILNNSGSTTLTSSSAPMLDASACGAIGGVSATAGAGANSNGNNGSDGYGFLLRSNFGTGAVAATSVGIGGALATLLTSTSARRSIYSSRFLNALMGAGAGSGACSNGGDSTSTSGKGGRGGGVLIINCAGAWNFTTAGGISVAGENGGNGTGSGGADRAGGGGGGGGGFFAAFYYSLTANTGTVTTTGGIGGNAKLGTGGTNIHGGGGGGGSAEAGDNGTASSVDGTKTGGDGGDGYSLIAENTEFV